MAEKHGKKRSNLLVDEDHNLHASIIAPATSASASLSRKKIKPTEDVVVTTTLTTGASSSLDSKEKKDTITPYYNPLSLSDIKIRIEGLISRIPIVPEEGIDPEDGTAVYDWATKTQSVIEEFNLLLCCISPATYKWASDRSGAADQSLNVLSGELGNAQEQISTCLSQRIANVLAPVVDLVVKSTVIHVDPATGIQTRTNTFSREIVDPSFLKLNCVILSRNSNMLRQVLIANVHKAATCIKDYMDAAKKDNQNDHHRSFAY